MLRRGSVVFAAVVLAASCAPGESPVEPQFGVVPEKGKPQEIACRTTDLKAVQSDKIKKNDCLFGNGQREHLYRADQRALGLPDLSGASMLTFTPDAEFNGIYGVANWDETRFGDPVYGFQTFTANSTARTFSVIGSAPEYKLFFSGADETQLGKYTLTTTVAPSANSCETGSRTFLQGSVAFSSAISDATACLGQVTVGPYAGAPLRYQFWYAKLTEGQSVSVAIDGVDGDDTSVTLAAIVFAAPGQPPHFAQLDFSQGAGDTDRALSFTAPFTAYYYIEVSASPGVASPYDLTFTTH